MKARHLALVGLCVAGFGVVGGCADFYAKSDMANLIDARAMEANALKPLALGGQLDGNRCLEVLATNAGTFAHYAACKTVNPLSYWFGDKSIFCSAEYATRLDRAAALSTETATRAATQPAVWRASAVAKEADVLVDVKKAKDGVK